MSTPSIEAENEFEFTVKVRSFGHRDKVRESAARAVLLGLARTVPGAEVTDNEDGAILHLGPKNFAVERYKPRAKKVKKSADKTPARKRTAGRRRADG